MAEARLPPNEHRELVHPQAQIRVEPSAAPVQEPTIREYPLTGSWLPGPDPFVIGAQNYTALQNLRYREGELQSVLGYSQLTAAPHATYTKGRNGIQFYKTINALPLSLLLVQAYNAALSTSAILVHTPAPPASGNFSSNVVHTDAAGAGLGRFALAPDQTVAYCNGRESMIWGGEESRIAAFFVTDPDLVPFKDYTEAVRSIAQDASSVAALQVGGQPVIIFGTTRPASGAKFYVQTPNAATSFATVDYWGVAGWTPASGVVDTTQVGFSTMAQTGSITWSSDIGLARVRWGWDRVLYFYRITMTAAMTAGTSVYYATANMPWQTVKDVWDGVEKKLIYLEMSRSGAIKDFTLEALEAESASTSTSTGGTTTTSTSGFFVPLGGLGNADFLVMGFAVPVLGIRFKLGQHNQGNASTFSVQYWDGNGWATPANFLDETSQLGRTGVMHWTPPEAGVEFRQIYAGVTGYFYRVSWSAALSADVDLDQVLGIPLPRRIGGFAFPFKFQNRLLLCGDLVGNDGHKVEYSAPDATEVWNGEDSSAEGKEIFFGEGGTLTAATEIYNRYAGSLAYLGVFCKGNETWLLSGNNPESFTIFPVSRSIGCVAPLTMISAEVAYSVSEDAQRNIALWLSEQGPVAFDGAVIVPLPGLEPYFDQNDARHINTQFWANARGWYDHQAKEWNLTFPSGTDQQPNNVWVVYDLRRQKWYEKVPASYMQGAFTVQDINGRSYNYGLIDTGHLLRLENGNTWNGAGITQVLEMSDLLPTNGTFEETMLRYLRVTLKRGLGQSALMAITHYADSSPVGSVIPPIDITEGASRLVSRLQSVNRTAVSHRLRFSTTTDQQVTWLLISLYFLKVRSRGR